MFTPPKRTTKLIIALLALAAATLAVACGRQANAVPDPSPTHIVTPTAASSTNPVPTSANLLMGRTTLDGTAAPGFTLTDQFGRKVSLSQFRGKAVFLAFMDDECTTICPLTTASLSDALNLLGAASKDVAIVAVNANPTATTTQDVYSYANNHGVLHQMEFLTGSDAQLGKVWKAYNIYVAIKNGDIDHTPALFLIDPQGNERYLYLTSGQYGVVGIESGVMAWDVAQVLPAGTAHVPPPPKMTDNPIASPAAQVSLPPLVQGKPNVQFGAGNPRVLVFFATWDPTAKEQLEALNAYESWAQAHGGPLLVGVDEGETEPSQAVARTRLSGADLSYPIAFDAHGYLADAYDVQNLAWADVVGSDGSVLAHYNGWVPTQSLIEKVKSLTGSLASSTASSG